MSEAVAVDIPSLIGRNAPLYNPSNQSNCLVRRYQLPEYHYPSYLRHPNQPFSSPSSPSSSSLSSISSYDQEDDAEENRRREQQNNLELHSISSDNDENENEDEDAINVSSASATFSVDGEFDVRVDIIQPSPEKIVVHAQRQKPQLRPLPKSRIPATAAVALAPRVPTPPVKNVAAGVYASAPPLSDDESERVVVVENENKNTCQMQQKQQKEEEECVCVICYETFETPVELVRGRNYSSDELEEIEGKQKITDYCQTCIYNVHHRCIDEYRLSKMTDILRIGYQRGYLQSPNITGIFGMKCLMCAKEVEKVHVLSNGDINIVKIQPGANEQQQQQQSHAQEEVVRNRIEEAMQNRIQRRFRRRQRLEFCRKKICGIFAMFLVTIGLLLLIFRIF